jgi:peptidoglycan/xylan/chitin deacetylase (PgdA/CDA1 family)
VLTTSWDDGHFHDMRVAELLSRHGLAGTFYIPAGRRADSLTPHQVRELSAQFEVGSHTFHEVRLPGLTTPQVQRELVDSKAWLEDLTGKPCLAFSPVAGKFHRRHLPLVGQAGYRVLRTVELLSVDFPHEHSGVYIMPTTIQVRDQPLQSYLRNFARRMAIRNFVRFATLGMGLNWLRLAESLLEWVVDNGGVFHVWGHGWEIEDRGQWHELEQLTAMMGQLRPHITALTNSDVCRATFDLRPPPAAGTSGLAD